MVDQVHMMQSIPPEYAVSQVVGYIKGRVRSTWHGSAGSASAIWWVRVFGPMDSSYQR